MKKSIILFFLVLFVSEINAFNFSRKTVSPPNHSVVVKPTVENPSNAALQALLKMKTTDIEKMLGRKLKFKEKIALKILKFRSKKALNNFEDVKSEEGVKAKKIGRAHV